MADRKHTPDVLGEILGEVALVEPPPAAPSAPAGRSARGQVGARSSGARAVGAETSAKPVRWEYCIVSFQNYHGWRARYVSGEEVADWTDGPLIHDYLRLLGENGWELAGASAGQALYGVSDYHQVYFKRPLVD
jgi:hypothetical protein